MYIGIKKNCKQMFGRNLRSFLSHPGLPVELFSSILLIFWNNKNRNIEGVIKEYCKLRIRNS